MKAMISIFVVFGAMAQKGSAIKCLSGQKFCCTPSNSAATSYTIDQAVGCISSGASCPGWTVSESAGEVADSDHCLCGSNSSVVTDDWFYNCNTDTCVLNNEPEFHAGTKALCDGLELLGDAVGKGFAALTTILIAVAVGSALLIGLCVYCVCCRKPQQVVIVQAAAPVAPK